MILEKPVEKRINLVQGEFRVSADPNVVFVTLLGSCIAVCIRDPIANVGGMNHFLLPGEDASSCSPESNRYGVNLMELLLNGLMGLGGSRNRLEAKFFGGARMFGGLTDIGSRNAEFASRFLKNEGIKVVNTDIGGFFGRRIQYWPVSGRARQSLVEQESRSLARLPKVNNEREIPGDVELF